LTHITVENVARQSIIQANTVVMMTPQQFHRIQAGYHLIARWLNAIQVKGGRLIFCDGSSAKKRRARRSK